MDYFFVSSPFVWKSLARLCVNTRRLDVACICLGNMRDIQGIWTLRYAQAEPELEARVAALAIHLQLYVSDYSAVDFPLSKL